MSQRYTAAEVRATAQHVVSCNGLCDDAECGYCRADRMLRAYAERLEQEEAVVDQQALLTGVEQRETWREQGRQEVKEAIRRALDAI